MNFQVYHYINRIESKIHKKLQFSDVTKTKYEQNFAVKRNAIYFLEVPTRAGNYEKIIR